MQTIEDLVKEEEKVQKHVRLKQKTNKALIKLSKELKLSIGQVIDMAIKVLEDKNNKEKDNS